VSVLGNGQFEGDIPSGAKAPLILWAFMYGLKPVPFKLRLYAILVSVLVWTLFMVARMAEMQV
jgi:hypothetical protein